ncbi:(2Fe-2S) ferredoxin domain-containing protein [Hymenobacter persicinus]|uniref:(2Fe-2S) ferredoxin domain-containing protein n=1 Tax=Hymenobacter persicinus TaxID=2025506 RepID=A0A4Q5LD05_9BACT|nr:(2Fe-2S) ferredoxin domain-containing protein [Hymenobacter persicinus]RYU80725.1 (2Fe-2S) ferredoxin domain-containing protein [Hymenobacter persicinus]
MPLDYHIFVCNNQKSEVGKDVAKALKIALKKQGLKNFLVGGQKRHSRVQTCNCLDVCKQCKKGPGAALVIYPEGTFYGDVKPTDAAELVQKHLGEGRPVKRLLLE